MSKDTTKTPQPGDFVLVTCYARISECGITGQGYWVQLPQTKYVTEVTPLPALSREAQQIVSELYTCSYIATWTLKSLFKAEETIDPLCGKDKYSEAMRELLSLKIIEELPDLGCRYRLVIPQAEVQG